ncbi:Tryptophan--tRNA ligase 2 [Aquicella siphonis]|uniref:Tryptophan--tRNA ligase n=1 Tax=Aquicella siphonis TaxID=254247 RepID=A0A5E4PF56_9COXI|nr:tryptophan--tRNA ligase [Aquicella siphonis]VVC75063.1 Tryptophan--tRNA ligase 2 [Aquicella siphonis]
MSKEQKPRLLTGDTSTGRLHLGHWVGSLENRVRMQDEYDCYFIIANIQAMTTRMDRPAEVHQHVMDVMLDYLAAGIDPARSTVFIQSEVPAIAELTVFFSLLVPYPRLMRNPTIKDEIRDKGLGDNYSVGFLLYPVSQVADILAFRPEVVPVGEDQIPHLELTREVARRFNQVYCHVDPQTPDEEYLDKGGLFPVVETKLGRSRRLVGIGPPGPDGSLLKMSKSMNNAIFLSDDPDTVKKKVMAMYTDPNRLKATDKGCVENNPLWIFHETFNPDQDWVREAEEKYRAGTIGDVECKRRLIDVLVGVIEPMRQRRLQYEKDLHHVVSLLKEGTAKANEVAGATLVLAKEAMRQRYF